MFLKAAKKKRDWLKMPLMSLKYPILMARLSPARNR